MQTHLHSLWNVHSRVQSCIVWQHLSPSGSGVHCPQPPCSGSGKHVPCYTGSWWSPARNTSQDCGFSGCPLEKPKYATQLSWSQFSSKHLPRIRVWLGRSLHSSISSAAVFSFLLQISWHALTPNHVASSLHTRPRDSTPLSAHFRIKGSGLNFLRDLISVPSYSVLVSTSFASPPISLTFFWLPVLVKARVPSDTGA